MRSEEDKKRVVWVGKVLILFRLRNTGIATISGKNGEFSYVQLMNTTKTVSGVDKAFEFLYLWWATVVKIDLTLYIVCYRGQDNISVGEYCGMS